MKTRLNTPLDCARAKCSEIERELKKSPDFHLYMLTTSQKKRARMERLLMEIPEFKLWRTLVDSMELETRRISTEKRLDRNKSHMDER